MVTLRGAESAAFNGGKVDPRRAWVDGENEGGDATGAKEGDWGGEAEEGGRVGGTLDFSPRRHADLNGGLAPNGFASCAR